MCWKRTIGHCLLLPDRLPRLCADLKLSSRIQYSDCIKSFQDRGPGRINRWDGFNHVDIRSVTGGSCRGNLFRDRSRANILAGNDAVGPGKSRILDTQVECKPMPMGQLQCLG